MAEFERIGIAIDARPVLNFSMQQNYISLIKNVRLTNTGDAVVENLTFVIKADPAFASDYRELVDRINLILSRDELFVKDDPRVSYVRELILK